MLLKDTVDMMVSEDYKERFKAEYFQLKTRLNGLLNMLEKWDTGKLDFTPTCPRNIYVEQVRAMEDYLLVLVRRAEMEKIAIGMKNIAFT